MKQAHDAWMNGELTMDGAPAYTDCWNPEVGAYKPDALRKAFLAGYAVRAMTLPGDEPKGGFPSKTELVAPAVHDAIMQYMAGVNEEQVAKPTAAWHRELNIPNTNPIVIGRCFAELARIYPNNYRSKRTGFGVIWSVRA